MKLFVTFEKEQRLLMKTSVCSQQLRCSLQQQRYRLKKTKRKKGIIKMRYTVEDIANCVDQQASEKSVGVVKSGRAGPGSQSASQDGWVVNVFQQEKPSSRARRAVWSRQLSLAAAPPCSPPKKQPMGINLRAWLAADLKQSACLSLSLSPSLLHTHSWNVPLVHP